MSDLERELMEIYKHIHRFPWERTLPPSKKPKVFNISRSEVISGDDIILQNSVTGNETFILNIDDEELEVQIIRDIGMCYRGYVYNYTYVAMWGDYTLLFDCTTSKNFRGVDHTQVHSVRFMDDDSKYDTDEDTNVLDNYRKSEIKPLHAEKNKVNQAQLFSDNEDEFDFLLL